MTPEEKMLERFTREKLKRKGGSLFDLEETEEDAPLTHLGQSLTFEEGAKDVDDFDDVELTDEDGSFSDAEDRPRKRRRSSADPENDASDVEEDGQPERKKTKAEVMKEVKAKSKLYKYERQQAKEDDEDLREELDRGLPDVLAALMGQPRRPPPPPAPSIAAPNGDFSINPDRAALLNGGDREKADKDYDARLRQMAMDKRAAPTERTKTEEEKAGREASRLKELEASRLRRMRGEDSENEDEPKQLLEGVEADEDFVEDDAAEFGLNAPRQNNEKLILEDEDEFEMDDDLIASGSEPDVDEHENSDAEGVETRSGDHAQDDEEDEFVRGILSRNENGRPEFASGANAVGESKATQLAYSYPCPGTHGELLKVLKDIPASEIPIVVQRIRALHSPQLDAENKQKLAKFSAVLVDHIAYMATLKQPLSVIETLIRHLHSLSRTYPETIATAFRSHLQTLHSTNVLNAGHLVLLTAIGPIYPTSDHFHQVVTPAITLMARWLGMSTVRGPQDLATGAYLVALCIKYQQLSKRYVPEAVRFTLGALLSKTSAEDLKPHIGNLSAMSDLWSTKSAFTEIFSPSATEVLKNRNQKKAFQRLHILLDQARLARRPLELHHHKPLAIKTSIPKFEESYNPDKHYDPDRERSDSAKLKAEYKRERKGAMRELRKDANFVAREQLREKKEADKAYETKYKRLVADIQGEEGREKNVYEREKRARKGKR
ncbi:hypothetical protein B0A49_11004 [Cryomyces minteri]|uniref:Nop14-like protein n=1 Tax=Cryomyces minteri TaxID=331657 RepID=A0A4U0WHW6_9PEZI|nr:hypothetical protein B0A49_11004 [Cryomyces minteri]